MIGGDGGITKRAHPHGNWRRPLYSACWETVLYAAATSGASFREIAPNSIILPTGKRGQAGENKRATRKTRIQL